MQQKDVKAYYKRQLYNGRGTLARAFDYLALRLFIFSGCYAWFYFRVHNQLLAIILSVVTVLMFSVAAELYKSMRLDSFVRKHNSDLAHKYMLERLALLNTADFRSLAREYARALCGVTLGADMSGSIDGRPLLVYAFQCVEKATAQQVLEAYRMAQRKCVDTLILMSASEFSHDAVSLAGRVKDIAVRLIPPEELLDLAIERGLLGHENAVGIIDEELEREKETRKQLQARPFMRGKVKGYLVCAGILVASSFIIGYQAYYMIVASVCVALSLIAWWMNRRKAAGEQNKHDAI